MLSEKKNYISFNEKLLKESPNDIRLDWEYVSEYLVLSEEVIREHSDKVDWGCISFCQKLSEEFIREFSDKVNWRLISGFQKLSEGFIREFSDKVNWWNISYYQKLSEGFIREFSDKVFWVGISLSQKLSEEFIQEYNLTIPETCWLYKDKEFKREHIKKNTKYEIIGDKVIAYKACKKDGYSVFNFQYCYEVGGEYEAHADYNIDNASSFGLSAWTKKEAIDYYPNGKLFKVEIDLKDIAAIVLEENKIRASKIKILEEIID